jgi:hypothetical protein
VRFSNHHLSAPENETWIAEQEFKQQQLTRDLMCTLLIKALRGLPNVRNINLKAALATGIGKRYNIGNFLTWRDNWTRTFEAFQALLTAITSSETSLDSLVIGFEKLSIPTHAIMDLMHKLESEGFVAVGLRLNTFAINLAMTTRPSISPHDAIAKHGSLTSESSTSQHVVGSNDYQNGSQPDFEGVSHLFRRMPNLESLEVNLYPAAKLPEQSYQSFLPVVFKDTWYFPRLRKLSFLGLVSSQESLQDILTRHAATLEEVDFENVVLSSGSWEPVFKTLSQLPSLTNLRLNLLATTTDRNEVNLEPIDRTLDPQVESKPFGRFQFNLRGINGPGPDDYLWYKRNISRDEIKRGLRFRTLPQPLPWPMFESYYSNYVLN